jgi:2-oxoglutarate dehydrogenase E2 component (dihydrolipoamide succinyltransferase)
MPVELVVPSVGESIREVEIGDWLKTEGQHVDQDDPVVVLETEKVTVELPAPARGVIARRFKQKGEKAAVGDVIGILEENRGELPGDQRPGGQNSAAPPHTVPQREPDRSQAPAPAPEPPSGFREEIVPMTPIRRRIAERLVEAQKNAALLTTFNQVDMTAVIRLRTEHQDAFHLKYGVRLGFMSFFVKAVIEALKMTPQINAEIRGHDIVFRRYYDIGIAIGGAKGLVVPVLRGAERMSFGEIEKQIADFAARAREGKLKVDELQGGTFTISNGGVYGSMLSTPIVNPPQSGVLGLHAIEDRPVARDGAVVVRPMMYLALSYDHRIVDGREAVTCLKRIR